MKNFLIILSLLFSLTLLTSCSDPTPETDDRLTHIVKMYETDVKLYGIDLEDAYNGLENIIIINDFIMGNVLGYYEASTNTIIINEMLLDYPVILKTTIYHELGHAAGMEHTCRVCHFIMSAQAHGPNITKYHGQPDFWSDELDTYFEYMKEILDKL